MQKSAFQVKLFLNQLFYSTFKISPFKGKAKSQSSVIFEDTLRGLGRPLEHRYLW